MANFNELRQEIKDDLSLNASEFQIDGFYSDAVIDRAINRALLFIGSLFRWAQTEKAYHVTPEATGQTTITGETTKAQEYYNYPSDFVSESIRRVTVANVELKKISFQEYTRYREKYPDGKDLIWSDYGRQYFINPNLLIGTLTNIVSIWGNIKPAKLSGGTDTHAFSNDSDIEEAMIAYALGLLYEKGRGSMQKVGQAKRKEAIDLASALNVKQRRAQSEYQSKDTPMFTHIDIIRGGNSKNPNNFNL